VRVVGDTRGFRRRLHAVSALEVVAGRFDPIAATRRTVPPCAGGSAVHRF